MKVCCVLHRSIILMPLTMEVLFMGGISPWTHPPTNPIPFLSYNSTVDVKKIPINWYKLAKQSSLATHDSVAISSSMNSEINEVLFLIDSEYKWITTLIRTGDKSSDSTTEFRSLISFLLMCFLIDFFIYTVVCKLNINIYLK